MNRTAFSVILALMLCLCTLFSAACSGGMPDLLFRNRVYDLAGIFNFGSESGNGMFGFYTNLPGSRMTELASCWESMKRTFGAR